MTEPLVYTIAETADLLKVSERTVRRMVDRGELADVRFGRRRVVPRIEIERLLAEATA